MMNKKRLLNASEYKAVEKKNVSNSYYLVGEVPTIKDLEILKNKNGSTEILCCLTVYNEEGVAILISLAALLNNLIYFKYKQENFKNELITVCIIADGVDNLSASAIDLFSDLKLLKNKNNYELFKMILSENRVSRVDILKQLKKVDSKNKDSEFWLNVYYDSLKNDNNDKSEQEWLNSKQGNINVVLCLKSKNLGKLNSHWWFFEVFCKMVEPKYCIQMDAGTTPKQSAIYIIWLKFEKELHSAASAIMGTISMPRNYLNLVHLWQAGDFLNERLLDWPADNLISFLNVIPGQFSLIRWKAISELNELDGINTESKIPLENYFRGLNCTSSLESNMFLAEDKILGYEIISSQNSNWQLQYIPSAEFVTEPCRSLYELIQQRRRWINSALSCHLWLFFNIRKYLINRSSFRDKFHIGMTIPWLAIYNLSLLIMPAVFFIITKNFLNQIKVIAPFNILSNDFIDGVFYFTIVLYVIQILMLQLFKFNILIRIIFIANIAAQVFIFINLLLFLLINNLYFNETLLLSFVLIFKLFFDLILFRTYSKYQFQNFVKYFLQYFIINPIFRLQIYTYSFCNFQDNSWGTKGLDIKNNEKSKYKIKILTVFGLKFLTIWLIPNIILTWYFCFENPERAPLLIKLVLYILSLITILKFSAGLYYIIKMRLKKI